MPGSLSKPPPSASRPPHRGEKPKYIRRLDLRGTHLPPLLSPKLSLPAKKPTLKTAPEAVRGRQRNVAVLFADNDAGNCLAHTALLARAGVHFSDHSRVEANQLREIYRTAEPSAGTGSLNRRMTDVLATAAVHRQAPLSCIAEESIAEAIALSQRYDPDTSRGALATTSNMSAAARDGVLQRSRCRARTLSNVCATLPNGRPLSSG